MTPELPLAGNGGPDLPVDNDVRARRAQPRRGRPPRAVHALRVTLTLFAALAVLLAGAPAHGDDLDDQKKTVERQMAQSQKDLNESTEHLSGAVAALERSQAELAAARAKLAKTRTDLAAAKVKDAKMAERLKLAKANLAKAKAAVAKGEKLIDAQKSRVGLVVRNEVQQRTGLLGIAVLVRNASTRDMSNRVQYANTIFGATQAGMDQLRGLQAQLERDKANQVAIETQVAADRKEAAANLVATRELERQAREQERSVTALVAQNAAAQAAAAKEVAADKARYRQLAAERDAVQKRIEVRIARAKAEAARQAAARQAAERRAAAAAKAQAAKSRKSASRPSGSKPAAKRPPARAPRSSRSTATSSSAHHGFIYPVSAPITSSYGMRFHPVLHYWKLHDGTDFGAGCGTAIRAPYSGRVAEKYFNGGYGNRLIIDHGMVDGRYVTTAMNHAIRYTVGVGQHVSQGQVIGYVGTTGYSTGCHLHLMVYVNGSMVNPMSWY